MTQVASDAARLTVARWTGTYVVPADHPDPEGLRRRVDDLVRAHLADSCSNWLSYVVDPGDPSVWRIRELRLSFSLADNACSSDDRVAQCWGENLASRIHEVLECREESESVLHFPDRVDYLARFIVNLAGASAWGKWYYEEFETLHSLPLNRAIVAAIIREKEIAAAVVLKIASLRRLETVLRVIGERDASELFEAYFDSAGAQQTLDDERLWTSRLLELWSEALLRPPDPDDCRFRDALRLLVRLGAQFLEAQRCEAVRAALSGLLELRRVLLAIHSPFASDHILLSAANGQLSASIALALSEGAAEPQAGLEFLARMSDGDAHWAQQAGAVLLGDKLRQSTLVSQGTLDGESIASQFAGAFLLGPAFVELALGDLAANAAGNSRDAKALAATIRHLIIVKCLGRPRAREAASDAALRLFSGFSESSVFDALGALAANPVDVGSLQKNFLQVLVDADRYDGRCLLVESLPIPGGEHRAVLLRDVFGDQWIFTGTLAGHEPDTTDTLETLLRSCCKVVGNKPKVLLLGSGLASLAHAQKILQPFADELISFVTDAAHMYDGLAGSFGVSPERFARLVRSPANDLEYFSLLDRWPGVALDPPLDLALTLISRCGLQIFASRLMGFESSSPEHLYQNILVGTGTIRSSPEKMEVRLPRSPLFIVLRLCGMHEQSFRLPWLEESELCLLPSEE